MELVIAAVVAAFAIVAVVMWVVWRATGAAIDWLIETFGNDAAVRRLHASKDARRRKRERGRDPPS